MPQFQNSTSALSAAGLSRRRFLRDSGAGVVGSLGVLGALGRTLAAQPRITPRLVQLSTDIEPIVRILESTPREKIFDAAADLFRSGVDYRRFMTALYLAGIRNVDSRSAGSRFHCVYVINSAHLLALESPAQERLLPMFWSLDDFKGAQASRPRAMGPLVTRPPAGAQAIVALRAAVHCWDRDAAEIALAGVARTCGAAQAFEELWRLGARDFRPIGHKAIFVANTWRTLQIIGWQHAEPALRALGQALGGNGTQFENGLPYDDQCHNTNDALVSAHLRGLPADWADSSRPESAADAAMASDLMDPIRSGSASEACRLAINLMTKRDIRAGAIWDVVHLAAAEFMLRRGDLGDVHAVTSVNALHFGFNTARTAGTRLFLLLQAVGWMAHFAFTGGLAARRNSAGPSILELATSPADVPVDPAVAAQQILSTAASDRLTAARAALGCTSRQQGQSALLTAARRLVFTRGSDTHDFKYPAAAFEDISIVSPAWRPHMLAASILHIPSPTAPESQTIQRARDAVAKL